MHAHGHFDMWVENRVILARLNGQWNGEMASKYSDEMKRLAGPLSDQTWAQIVYLDDWELGTPEFEAIINDLVAWVIEHRLTRTAQVYSHSMIKKMQMDRMVKEEVGAFQRQVFAEESEAFAWLADEGFEVEHQVLIHKAS